MDSGLVIYGWQSAERALTAQNGAERVFSNVRQLLRAEWQNAAQGELGRQKGK